MRHKHADLMKLFAEDTSIPIQVKIAPNREWQDLGHQPMWAESYEYRIKPKPVTKEEAKKAFEAIGFRFGGLGSNPVNILKTYFDQP